jgi:peptidoglycan/LPS O-acetylase OafA/YrhL
MRTTNKKDSHFLPTLDGWRGIAILIVVLSHDALHVAGPLSTRWFQINGRAGVDIFFALSGILICTRLLREESRSGTIDLRQFYLRRFFRIQPAAWVYLFVVVVLMLLGVLDHEFRGILTSLLLVRNYLPLNFSPQGWYSAHFWSLAVEEHFYLILPGFLLFVRKRRATAFLAVTFVLLVWQVIQRKHPWLQYGWAPEDHTDIAVTGILLASYFAILLHRPVVRAWCERWLNPYVTVGVTVVLLLIRGQGRLIFDLLLLCAYPLALVSTMLHPHTLFSRLLDWKPLRALGLISYSVYLWQMLFFTHTAGAIPPTHSAIVNAIQQSTPLRYIAVLGCSTASYFLIEQPLIRFGRTVTNSRQNITTA